MGMRQFLLIILLFAGLISQGQTPMHLLLAKKVSGSIIPAILTDGNTVGWYIASATGTITKDGSNKVSQWNDTLGSGHNLLNDGTADFTPTWSATGITFNGAYNYMAASFTLNQPEFIYIVINIASTTLDYSPLFNGVGGYTNGVSMVINCSTSPITGLSAGTTIGYPGFVANSYIILRYLINGASSKIIVNAGTPVTGNAGANNMGGFTLGSDNGAGYAGGHSNIVVKEAIIRKTADNSTNETAIYNYLKTRYGL